MCFGRESNPYGHCCPRDFKSRVSTYSTTKAVTGAKIVKIWIFLMIPVKSGEEVYHSQAVLKPRRIVLSQGAGPRRCIDSNSEKAFILKLLSSMKLRPMPALKSHPSIRLYPVAWLRPSCHAYPAIAFA